MKHRNDIRFATTGSALHRTGRAPCVQAGMATTPSAVARRCLSWRLVVPVALATAIAAQPAALAAALVCAIAARSASGCAPVPRAPRRRVRTPVAPSTLSRARRRPFSSVRLTLMQDHSS
ncbi:hypothetical protein [Burkholderia anthina]|uniref:hypothetical protein n=1 Tax=Burkholderia anthina TaxID=179879 RepID=UPI00158BF3D5|nr:hypothetical protein [Burkholderia anthina]